MKPLTYTERCAMGLHARKQMSRAAHGKVRASDFSSDALELLAASMQGRVPALIPIKYERMAASPFGFLRGAVPVMAADLAALPNTGLMTQLCGDAHILNLGAYAGPDGQLVFDINDFDETIRGPFEWDVKRLATSLLLAGRQTQIDKGECQNAVRAFVANYCASIHNFGQMPVVDLARFQIRRINRIQPVAAIFKQAERSTPKRLLAKLTCRPTAHPDGRRFKQEPPLLFPLPASEHQAVLRSLYAFAASLAPERRHFLQQYEPRDVAFKVAGTGSVGLRNYVVYLAGQARALNVDPLFLEIKEEPGSAYARYLPPENAAGEHQGERVMNGQRALQLASDPFLGYTSMDGRDYLVRQLNDHKASLDVASLTAESLSGYAVLCGELLARGHARAGDPVSIAAYIGSGDRFSQAILRFASAYTRKTERDWAKLRHWLRNEQTHEARKAHTHHRQSRA